MPLMGKSTPASPPVVSSANSRGRNGKVSGDRDVARFRAQAIADPLRRIVRLQIAAHREFRERVARAPEFLSGLLRAQLAAVPHHVRLGAEGRGFRGDARRAGETHRRQRTPRIFFRSYRDAVMY